MNKEILIIDDNTDIRNIINDLINDAGYKTRLAANYNQALNEIDKKLPDVAIIDVKLDKGDNDGLELLAHIKTKDKNIPVIIITGHANIEMAIKALKAGAFEFIEKPFNQERLLNFVNRAVENINLKNKNKEFENKLFYSYELIGESENIKDIKNEIKNGNFREDLYHRLNVFEINVESLKNRVSDIPLLVEYFSEKISTNYNLVKLDIDTNNNYLLNYDWPGNVRELRNLIERIAILSPDSPDKISSIIKESLKVPDIDIKTLENSLSIPLKEARENFEKEYLTTQLKKFNGSISKTASFIGMERSALHRKLKGLGIKELN